MSDRVNYFEIGTTDPETARTFYGGLFGWAFGAPDDYSMVNGMEGGLWDTTNVSGESWAIFYVDVEDIHATVEAAVAAGATVVLPVVDNGPLLFAHLSDPAGNRFGVWQRKG